MLGLCIALTACGDKFVVFAGSGGAGGTSNGGGSSGGRGGSGGERVAGTGGVGEGGNAGIDDSVGSAGSAGASDGGEAGSDTGGVGGVSNGGAGGLSTNPGGGSSGNAGSGGKFIEPSLPQEGLLVWLRADRGVQEKDGAVEAWQDQSGNQLHASKSSLNTRPTYLATGFNGRPTLEFDGQGQFLKLPEGFGDFSKGLTGFIVAKPTKSDCASMVELSNGSEIDDVALGMWQNKWAYEVEKPLIHSGNVEQAAFSLYAVNHRPAGPSELRINGSVLGSLELPLPALPASGLRTNNFVGHTLYGESCEYFKGQMSEFILYSRTLPNLDVIAIEKYLDSRWSLSTQVVPVPTP